MSTDVIYSDVKFTQQQASGKRPIVAEGVNVIYSEIVSANCDQQKQSPCGDPKPSCESKLEVQTARCNPLTLVLVACCVLLASAVITLGVLYYRHDYDALFAKYRELEILSNFTERNLTDFWRVHNALLANYKELENLNNLTERNLTDFWRVHNALLAKYKDLENLSNLTKRNFTENVNKLQNNLLDANRSLESCKGELLNKSCPVGWNYSNGKCYYFSNDLMKWTQSRDKCVSMGGHLTIIETAAEQKFLSEVLPNKFGLQDKIWIGLTDSLTEGLWLWVDNTQLNASNTFWGTNINGNEPDNWKGVNNDHPMGEDCVRLGFDNNNIAWYDAFCEDSFKSICETRGFN